MSEPPTTRSNDDGFRGEYPAHNEDWADRLYRENGMEPPWTLEYEDGHVVTREKPRVTAAPRHEA